jgi:zinc protease
MRNTQRTIACFILALFLPIAGNSFAAEIKFNLQNGMEVVIKENPVSPIVAVQVWVKAGSTTEPPLFAGISHVLEHMAFKGTKKRGVGEIAREVESLGGEINAYTTFDHTVYHITISSRYVDRALEILADTLAHSVFDPFELKKEVEVVMEEYRMNQDSPGRVVSKNLFSGFFKKHPYGRPVIGYPETLSRITREAVVSYFQEYYVPNNMALVVVGDVRADAVRPMVEKHMAQLKPKTAPPFTQHVEPERGSIKVIVKKMDTKRAYLDMAFPGVSLTDPDVYSYDLLSMVLGQGETSRLYSRVKDELSLVDSIYTYSFTPKDPGLMLIGATLEPENVKDAIEATLGEIYNAVAFGVSGSELERARKNTIADFVYSLESQSSLARLLGFYETVLGNPFFQKKYADMVRRVTREDVHEVTRKCFKEDNFVLSLVLPQDSDVTLTEDEVRAIAKKSYERVLSKKEESAADIERITLSNGIRVITRENNTVPVVAVNIGFLGGLRAETPEVNGISNLVSYMLTRGTASHEAPELSEIIEGMAGSIGAFSGRNSFGIQGKFLSEDFEKGLKLMSEMILTPTFSVDEMEKKKKEMLAAIKAQKDSPVKEIIRLYLKSQYGNHPYSLDPQGRVESVTSLARDNLIEFYNRLVVPKNMVIVVSGNVGSDQAKNTIAAAFEAFSREGDLSLVNRMEISPPENAITVEEKREKLQAHFVIGFLGTTFTDEDRYPLKVLSSTLAGQGGRLFKELRDNKSLAYSLTAFSSEQYDRGFLAFYMGTAGDKLVEAKNSMWDEIVKFLKEGITEEELERAKNYVIGNFEIGLQSNSAYADSLMFNELYGTGIDEFLKFPDRIKAVTEDQVMIVAKKYIDMKRYILAIISP